MPGKKEYKGGLKNLNIEKDPVSDQIRLKTPWHEFRRSGNESLIQQTMNLKRIFGFTLTLLGTIGLIYAAVLFVNGSGGKLQIKALIVYGLLGLLFFASGIGLIRTTKDGL